MEYRMWIRLSQMDRLGGAAPARLIVTNATLQPQSRIENEKHGGLRTSSSACEMRKKVKVAARQSNG